MEPENMGMWGQVSKGGCFRPRLATQPEQRGQGKKFIIHLNKIIFNSEKRVTFPVVAHLPCVKRDRGS